MLTQTVQVRNPRPIYICIPAGFILPLLHLTAACLQELHLLGVMLRPWIKSRGGWVGGWVCVCVGGMDSLVPFLHHWCIFSIRVSAGRLVWQSPLLDTVVTGPTR